MPLDGVYLVANVLKLTSAGFTKDRFCYIPTTFCRSTRHHGDVAGYVCVHEYFKKLEFLLPSTALLAGALFEVVI